LLIEDQSRCRVVLGNGTPHAEVVLAVQSGNGLLKVELLIGVADGF
jgi:hypothetical protein